MLKLNHLYKEENILFVDKHIRNGGDDALKEGLSEYTVVPGKDVNCHFLKGPFPASFLYFRLFNTFASQQIND